MQEHHLAWLSKHADRNAAWLQQALEAGFDVHHLDGDRSNNDPDNLVLIERRDHAVMHGFSERFVRDLNPVGGVRGARKKTLARGQAAVAWRKKGLTWREVGQKLGCSHVAAMNAAKVWRNNQ